ncbi:MAG: EF-P lysine aminoacylase EpmA [Gammaproteobacteria bacterium]|nr:EF-P lysine aminoacylase EpmA [Gammaproteobacteria bacterium]
MTPWQPTATITTLRKRAEIIQRIRAFFVERDILEVDTPLLSEASVTDPHVHSISANYAPIGGSAKKLFLQTSPEYAMKRLLAAHSGPIYQICKAFRQDITGRYHQPEFTMLEWYRPGFDHHQLMDEMDALLIAILNTPSAKRITYQNLFEIHCNINPHTCSDLVLQQHVAKNIELATPVTSRNDCLDLLLTHCIEPNMEKDRPIFIYDFPITQAALAKIRSEENPPVASRFEVYFQGVELANGFHELLDASEQRNRFESDLHYRALHHLPEIPLDMLFLAALNAGLPDCAGVALGLDRLILLALNKDFLKEVLSFGA